MYLVIFTTYNDANINKINNIEYRLCSTEEKAEQVAIDLLYKNIKEYFNKTGGNLFLNNRADYSMNNINDLLTLIETTYIKYKFDFTINKMSVESYIRKNLNYKLS